MQLTLSETTINYPILRLESVGKQWELGIYPTLYGTRVSCDRIGSDVYLRGGYCCGTDATLLMEVTIAVSCILSKFPESATNGQVERALPSWNLRPINLDDGLAKLREAVHTTPGEITQFLDPDKVGDRLTEVCENLMLERYKTMFIELGELS